MHIHRTRSSILLRESYREGSAVKKRTLQNITNWSAQRLAALEAALKEDLHGRKFTSITDVELETGKNFGALFAFSSVAKYLGLSDSLGSSRPVRLALMRPCFVRSSRSLNWAPWQWLKIKL